MNKKYFVLFIILNSFFKLCAQLEQLDVVHYTTSNGLSNSCVYSICQDKEGFLWVSTEFGVNKFDGNSFNSYDNSNGFIENVTLSCANGPNKSILIGTFSTGIAQIHQDGKISKLIDPFEGEQVLMLYYTDSLLYCSSKSDACIYNLRTKQYHYYKDRNSGKKFDSIINVVALFGNKLIIGNKYGICLFSDKNIKPINSNIKLTNVSAIYTNDKSIWIGTKGVIYRLNPTTFVVTDSVVFDNKRENMLDCILLDSNNDIWFSTILPITLYRASIKNEKVEIENMSEKLGIDKTSINGLILDREKNIWIGTYNKGLYCVKNSFIKQNPFLKESYITSIFADTQKSYYVSCFDGIYVSNSDKTKWDKINADKNNREYTYGCIEYKHTIYFLTNGKYTDGCIFKSSNRKIIKVAARALVFLNDSIALFGGWKNQVEIRKKNKDNFDLIDAITLDKNNIGNNRVSDLVIDKNGVVWCASDLGIFKIDISKKQSQKIKYDTISSKINDIEIDKHNTVWFASENHIVKFDQNKWQKITEINNQKLGVVNSLAVDERNRLYVGTLKGLFVIENGVSNYIDDKSGLSSNEINELFYDSLNNKILIAANDGFSEFSVDLFDKFKKLPLSINFVSTYINDSIVPISKNYFLENNQNNIRLKFVAINLTFPRSVSYQYRIDNGLWLNLNSNVLELASLVYGSHNVDIRASLDNKNWSKYETVFITVATPIYLTFWFWLIVIASLILISFLAIRFRVNFIRKKANERYLMQKQLEELKFKSLNATINPHFIFNSLNSIQNYINHNDKDNASNYLGKFARLIRLVLDKANEKEITIKNEIERLTYYMQLEQDRFGNNFTFKINTSKQVYDIIIPNMIIQPVVENSIIHGIKNIKNAHIEITFELLKNVLTITIEDNGVGIDATIKGKTSNHKSMAINNINERLTLYPNSSLIIKDKKTISELDCGTIVQIKLHLN